MKLICVFVFAYAKSWFSHDMAHMSMPAFLSPYYVPVPPYALLPCIFNRFKVQPGPPCPSKPHHVLISFLLINNRGARWPSGRVSDSGARGLGFDTFLRRVVSLSKDTFTPRKVLVIPRKRWLRPDMTGKLLTGTLSISTNKN